MALKSVDLTQGDLPGSGRFRPNREQITGKPFGNKGLKAQQKSESPIIPQGRGNPSSIDENEQRRGGKGTPVKKAAQQLLLPFTTAETPCVKHGAEGRKRADPSARPRPPRPKVDDKDRKRELAMEEVVGNLQSAFLM